MVREPRNTYSITILTYVASGIASASKPPVLDRIYAVQPLWVAGRCLSHHRERKAILDLLKSIEDDLGWPTYYRVEQLEKEWGWVPEEQVKMWAAQLH